MQPETPSPILELVPVRYDSKLNLPLFTARVEAGFPSPADDYIESRTDLNELLIDHPSATFMVRVSGDSMQGIGIQSGDLLVVDRALEAKSQSVVIAVVNGELTVKRVQVIEGQLYLVPENEDYAPIEITDTMDFEVWGVVTYVIHSLRN